MRNCDLGFVFFLVYSSICSPPLRSEAGLVLNPTGQLLFDGSGVEDQQVELATKIAYGNGFKFYGVTRTNIYVSENGNLAFAADPNDFFPTGLSSAFSKGVIAPLWDDYLLDPTLNNSVRANYIAGESLAVTWENVRLYNETAGGVAFPPTQRSTQVVWFENDVLVRGFQFRKDDIAFGYVPHKANAPDFFGAIEAVVGLNEGNGRFSALPGTTDGSVNANAGGLIPRGENEFLLFRPGVEGLTLEGMSYQGGYYRGNFSLTAVPEASTFLQLIAVIMTSMGYLQLRRWRTRNS